MRQLGLILCTSLELDEKQITTTDVEKWYARTVVTVIE